PLWNAPQRYPRAAPASVQRAVPGGIRLPAPLFRQVTALGGKAFRHSLEVSSNRSRKGPAMTDRYRLSEPDGAAEDGAAEAPPASNGTDTLLWIVLALALFVNI